MSNTQARIAAVTPEAAEMGAKIPGTQMPRVQSINPDGSIEWTPETHEMLRKARAYEASVKPHAERVWRQYTRGLLTFWEMIEGMTLVDSQVEAHTQKVRDLQEAGWTINPELVDHIDRTHARLLATGWKSGDGPAFN